LRAQPRSVLLDLLLAAALAKKEDRDGALAVLGEVLAEVPSQPTAAAMRRSLGGDARVAMADPAGLIDPLAAEAADPLAAEAAVGTIAVANPPPEIGPPPTKAEAEPEPATPIEATPEPTPAPETKAEP